MAIQVRRPCGCCRVKYDPGELRRLDGRWLCSACHTTSRNRELREAMRRAGRAAEAIWRDEAQDYYTDEEMREIVLAAAGLCSPAGRMDLASEVAESDGALAMAIIDARRDREEAGR